MISTLFNSASFSAVTTVIMFLVTYIPYVTIISMEAMLYVIGFGYKFLLVSRSSNLIIFNFINQKCN